MLPSEPKIFHGRHSEVSDILDLFKGKTPRIAILGAGGMGKSSLAKALLHHSNITTMYQQNRVFVGCSLATTKMELVALIGTHIGLELGKDPIQAVLKQFSNSPPSLLILDELETLWESTESRGDIEELLSLLTDINHLALMVSGWVCVPMIFYSYHIRSLCVGQKDQQRCNGQGHFCCP
jgi:AAA+ superfamily predicted ATPase